MIVEVVVELGLGREKRDHCLPTEMEKRSMSLSVTSQSVATTARQRPFLASLVSSLESSSRDPETR